MHLMCSYYYVYNVNYEQNFWKSEHDDVYINNLSLLNEVSMYIKSLQQKKINLHF